MSKDSVKYLINKSSTASYLFSCCDILKLAANKLIEISSYEDTGISRLELNNIESLGYDVDDLRIRLASIAVGISEDIHTDSDN